MDAGRKRIFLDDCIGIKKQDIFAMGHPYGLVVCLGKTQVYLVFDEDNPGKLFVNHLTRTVNRVVIHHHYLCTKVLNGFINGMKALLEEILYVIIYYDNRKVHEWVQ
jgi:hypothetical protein